MERLRPVGAGLRAYTFAYDDESLAPIRDLYRTSVAGAWEGDTHASALAGGADRNFKIEHAGHRYRAISYGTAPLLWVSSNDASTHDAFRLFFDSLGIEEDVRSLLDCEKHVMLYCGFFVVGNRCPREAWHVDYFDGANAFTLLTPLFPLNPAHGHLLYQDMNGASRRYSYKPGEALIVGERFRHSTETYLQTPDIRVLLSLTFGTDRLKYWDVLEKTIGTQSEFLILPCGHARGTCACLPKIGVP